MVPACFAMSVTEGGELLGKKENKGKPQGDEGKPGGTKESKGKHRETTKPIGTRGANGRQGEPKQGQEKHKETKGDKGKHGKTQRDQWKPHPSLRPGKRPSNPAPFLSRGAQRLGVATSGPALSYTCTASARILCISSRPWRRGGPASLKGGLPRHHRA